MPASHPIAGDGPTRHNGVMTDVSTIARWVRVRGKVQGVAFRFWTQQNARALDIVGWVRNDVDGSVEAFLQGSEDNVARLIERMRGGPPAAKVDALHTSEAAPADHDDFEIRR